ncbi:MAG: TetR family transcriptional regulator [Polyangiaceae bacterium]
MLSPRPYPLIDEAGRPVAPPKRERNAVETKRRLLDAAEAEFAAKGFAGARLGNIARVAQVQQALIHHYFSDKSGLYREVIDRALAAMTAEGFDILARLARPLDATKIHPLVDAFVDLLMRFYVSHGAILAILRHEGATGESTGGSIAEAMISARVKPVFDAVVQAMDDLRAMGKIRADVNPRQLCVSALAMTSITIVEEPFIRGVWPVDFRSPEFIEERKREIVATVLGRLRL